ncbi:hypothetical protein H3Z83_07415 [Tenacibaculum sp. S7007]|uniref:Lipoprotein n=1 Tax=Tenacibaculum pelagium TaxID=2759527 RepID=A0A839APN6_9FLAO|nr:hypothetical protein [Tenacibaculum pelagium]MBA6156340.1 hypothetical protein [Tenacibaculum pelagium]
MKKLAPYFLVFSIIFTSCSSNENEVLEDTQEKLLQSYTLKRDANGAYSIDFNTTNNTDVTAIKNTDNSNEIILSEVNHKTAVKHSNDFNIENDYLKIGFLEANQGKRTKISIEDENPTFAKGVTEFLNSYSITKNTDGTFQLKFKVNDNVNTDFVYNEDIETYEVHLSTGDSKQKDFSRTINLSSDDLLKIDFVNHKYSGKSTEETAERKPKLEIGNGNDII